MSNWIADISVLSVCVWYEFTQSTALNNQYIYQFPMLKGCCNTDGLSACIDLCYPLIANSNTNNNLQWMPYYVDIPLNHISNQQLYGAKLFACIFSNESARDHNSAGTKMIRTAWLIL